MKIAQSVMLAWATSVTKTPKPENKQNQANKNLAALRITHDIQVMELLGSYSVVFVCGPCGHFFIQS